MNEYRVLLEQVGLQIEILRMEYFEERHSPERVWDIVVSGTLNGYLGSSFFVPNLSEDEHNFLVTQWVRDFRRELAEAAVAGLVTSGFNRLYALARKPMS